MRIDSSAIQMESARKYTSVTARSMRASIVRGKGNISGNLGSLLGNLSGAEEDTAQAGKDEETEANLKDISTHFRNTMSANRTLDDRVQKNAVYTLKQQCMKFLMELLSRWRGERFSQEDFTVSEMPQQGLTPVYQIGTMTNQYYYKEEESTTFQTAGLVKTADGRELSFNLQFGMSRSFEKYYEETYVTRAVSYCDPLVINLDTNIAQVSDQKFFFDLDGDGSEEEISALKKGSGFLALDLNGDGKINDGGELFGTKSGNGFADLSQHDSDNNGWIDEGDPIWEKLLVWTKDDEGNDKLYHLADLGVGAIGLTNVATQFALNSKQDNQTNAMIRNTGIFLYENGTVSTVQHLDLAR